MTAIPVFAPWDKPSQFPGQQADPTPYLGLLRPPVATAPAHPYRPELPPPPKGYTRTLHAAPSAWPRQLNSAPGTFSRLSTPFGAVPAKETKEERAARNSRENRKCVAENAARKEWTLDEAKNGGQPALWLASERWRRDEQVPGGLTLVYAHANGLNKETWMPTARRLLERAPSAAGAVFGTGEALANGHPDVVVNDVWFIDDAYHGVSVDLNAGHLADSYAWADYGRDMLNFVLHVLPKYSRSATDQWQLEWNDEGTSPKVDNVVGIGHSFGGNGWVSASFTRPDVASALFLVEPMMDNPIVGAAIKRRSNWPSVKAADAANRNNPLFATWDADVFQTWLTHHIVPVDPSTPDGEVTLATPSWAEAAVFSDPNGSPRGWDRLPRLRVPAGFLMAENEDWMGGEDLAREMSTRAPRARNERVMNTGHLLPQEAPEQMAEAMWRYLTTLAAGEWDKTRSKM